MSKNPPDWWARVIGGFGLLIALGGLALTYINNRWQKQIYEKSLEERVFVQLSAAYDFSNVLWAFEKAKEPPSAALVVEVVNLSTQPMYCKGITGEFGGHKVLFYEHDPVKDEPMRRLEPGEAADYKIFWQGYMENTGIVEVDTTKSRLSQPVQLQLDRVTVRDFLQLMQLIPGTDKPLPSRHRKARRAPSE